MSLRVNEVEPLNGHRNPMQLKEEVCKKSNMSSNWAVLEMTGQDNILFAQHVYAQDAVDTTKTNGL